MKALPATLISIDSKVRGFRVPRKKINELIAFVESAEKASFAEIDIAIVNDEQMATINQQFLNHEGTTDVITFDLSNEMLENGVCGEIVICCDAAAREADERKITTQRELLLYVTHGLLHLLDYDDTKPKPRTRMHARQEELLDAFLTK
jgi:probable rRNA maturation factor